MSSVVKTSVECTCFRFLRASLGRNDKRNRMVVTDSERNDITCHLERRTLSGAERSEAK